jgi:hypothetical protein
MLDHDTDAYYKISRAFTGGPPSVKLTRDHILDNITLYRLTGTGASAARFVLGERTSPSLAAGQPPPQVRAPGRVHNVPRRDLPGPLSWVEPHPQPATSRSPKIASAVIGGDRDGQRQPFL